MLLTQDFRGVWRDIRSGHHFDKDLRGAWAKACEAAGLSGRILHDFRRTAVRNLERAGVSRSSAMKMTGHKTEAVYRRYAIVSEQDLHEAAAKLAKLDLPSSPAQNLHSRG